jgi:hypothetical protein
MPHELTILSTIRNRSAALNLLSEVKRPGIRDLAEYLYDSDYFLAPASTKYHNNFYGGLCLHSLDVTRMFLPRINSIETEMSRESAIVCGLLHDLCKVDYYYRNQNGEWKANKEHPANKLHGCLSVQIAEQFIKLTDEERDVIKFHMGLFSCYGYVKEYSAEELHDAISRFPSVQIFGACDMEEAHLRERKVR